MGDHWRISAVVCFCPFVFACSGLELSHTKHNHISAVLLHAEGLVGGNTACIMSIICVIGRWNSPAKEHTNQHGRIVFASRVVIRQIKRSQTSISILLVLRDAMFSASSDYHTDCPLLSSQTTLLGLPTPISPIPTVLLLTSETTTTFSP